MVQLNKSMFFRLGTIFFIAFLFLFSAVSPVEAAVIIEDDGTLDAGEVIDDDLILTGEKVVMNGTVNGMLLAMGAQNTINGIVNGDVITMGSIITIGKDAHISGNLFAGASIINVEGTIDGSIAAGSTAINLQNGARVGGNIYYGGYSLSLDKGATIGRDLRGAGYQMILNGDIAQDLHAGAAALEIGGTVGGNAKLNVEAPGTAEPFNPMMFSFSFMPPEFRTEMPETIPPGLRISDTASIGGQLTYTSPEDQVSAIEAQPQGGIVFQTPVPESDADKQIGKKPVTGIGAAGAFTKFLSWFIKIVRNFFTLLILGALAFWLIPRVFRNTVDQLRSNTWRSAGWGFVTLIVGYAAVVVIALIIIVFGIIFSLITLGGLSRTIFGVGFSSLALAFTVFQFTVSYGGKLVAAFLVGDLVVKSMAKNKDVKWIWALLVGVIIYVILRAIPLVGWLLGFAATVFGMGAIFLLLRNKLTKPTEIAETSIG